MVTIGVLDAVVAAFVVAVGWLFVIFKMLPSYRVDVFRQRLFELRAKLFRYAAAGNVRFDDPAYFLLRRRINVLIRHAHHVSLFRICATLAAYRLTGTPIPENDVAVSWDEALDQVDDPAVRACLEDFERMVVTASSKHLIRGSVPLLTVIGTMTFVRVIVRQWKGVRRTWCDVCKDVLKGPMAPRKIESYAECVTN